MCLGQRRSFPHMTPSGMQNTLPCPRRCKAKPNNRKQTNKKGSRIRQNKCAPSLLKLGQYMTQFCSWETQSSVRDVGCLSESTRPRNQKTQPAWSPLGYESSWRIYSWPPISSHQTAHLPKSNSTLNITQPRKNAPLCFLSDVGLQLGLSNTPRCTQRSEMRAHNCIRGLWEHHPTPISPTPNYTGGGRGRGV